MLEVAKFLVPLFLTTKTYDDMRQKLAAFMLYQIWLVTYLLRRLTGFELISGRMDNVLIIKPLRAAAPWLIDANMSGLLIASALSLIAYIFHFHDRLSDLFLIRWKFDNRYIIKTLAKAVGTSLGASSWQKIDLDHDRYMRLLFYTYTSSRAEKPLVDKHDIEQALDAWSWFWIGLEGAAIWFISAVVAQAFGDVGLASVMVGIGGSMILLMAARYPGLTRRARAQVQTIADDPSAAAKVKAVFNAL